MLKNNVIIYDHECPMCAVYTDAFLKSGLLDKDGRYKYADLDKFSAEVLIDKDRARHEIALVDTEKMEVRYGLDSLFYILATRFPALNLLFKQKYFVLIMKELYYFISYNRKIIAPSPKQDASSCVPDFHLKYRVLYILGMLYVVASFAIYFDVFLLFWAYWAAQVIFSMIIFKEKTITYLGHQITILLIACLLMIPSIFFSNLLYINILISLTVVIKEFWRRWKVMKFV
ncbi:MAG: DUF393 domain-containing protein [Cytophagales bacterium]|nr:MAG: DUF393 domain-containing protein [Cytophagales bacterium]